MFPDRCLSPTQSLKCNYRRLNRREKTIELNSLTWKHFVFCIMCMWNRWSWSSLFKTFILRPGDTTPVCQSHWSHPLYCQSGEVHKVTPSTSREACNALGWLCCSTESSSVSVVVVVVSVVSVVVVVVSVLCVRTLCLYSVCSCSRCVCSCSSCVCSCSRGAEWGLGILELNHCEQVEDRLLTCKVSSNASMT